jgi:hypothetical protein
MMPTGRRMSDAEIARHAGVSDRFVAKLRPATPNGSGLRKRKDGKQRRMPQRSRRSSVKGKQSKAIATASFETTQEYLRTAEAVRDGFGVPFPILPASLIGNEGNRSPQTSHPELTTENLAANGVPNGIRTGNESSRGRPRAWFPRHPRVHAAPRATRTSRLAHTLTGDGPALARRVGQALARRSRGRWRLRSSQAT